MRHWSPSRTTVVQLGWRGCPWNAESLFWWLRQQAPKRRHKICSRVTNESATTVKPFRAAWPNNGAKLQIFRRARVASTQRRCDSFNGQCQLRCFGSRNSEPSILRAYPVRVIRLGQGAPSYQLTMIVRKADAEKRALAALQEALRYALEQARYRRRLSILAAFNELRAD
jgi:hypothetical protein